MMSIQVYLHCSRASSILFFDESLTTFVPYGDEAMLSSKSSLAYFSFNWILLSHFYTSAQDFRHFSVPSFNMNAEKFCNR